MLLSAARIVVALVPLRIWRGSVGGRPGCSGAADAGAVKRLAEHIERAAWRLPFKAKCLPQAIALSWQLRRRGFGHRVVFAVRPPALRKHDDALHAWVECGGAIVLGALDGPWLAVHAQGSDNFATQSTVSDC
jgi:hypothetical protein